MKISKRIVATGVVILALVLTGLPCFGLEANDLRALQGIQTLVVMVEDLKPHLQGREGLSRQILQNQVELRLRQSGIQVLSEEAFLRLKRRERCPILYLNVVTMLAENNSVVFAADLELLEDVAVLRPPARSVVASTWNALGVLGCKRLEDVLDLKHVVNQLVDQFIRTHEAANRKTPTDKQG